MTSPRLLPRTPARAPELRYVRAPVPVHFPEEEEVPEGLAHLIVRTFLFQLLQYALGPEHSVGSDQFVYWLANDARRCLSPDVFVRLGVAQTIFGSWKTWENGGAPDLAVEIVSPNEGDGIEWEEKLARYRELGVRELVRFDPEEPEGRRLRAWDRVRGDLVERSFRGDRTPCVTLGSTWVVAAVENQPVGLRLADEEGRLLESEKETAIRARAVEASAREAEARAREAEARARVAAEARVAELEEELRRLRGERER